MSHRRALWILSLVLWPAVGLLCGLQIWTSMLSHGHALWRVLLYQVLVWYAWLPFSMFIVWLARRRPMIPPRPRAVGIHAVAALAIAALHAAWWALLLVEIQPYDAMNTTSYERAYRAISLSELVLELLFYGGVLAAHYAADYYGMYRDREVSLAKARLHALDLQLRPHFLFNTLNSISALVRVDRRREATEMIAGLSDLLRYSLDTERARQVPLDAELAIVRRYLEIERLRFPDRLAFEIDVDPDARDALVPALLLQPLVENAIRHGVAPQASPGCVSIRACRDGADLRIEVFNTGELAADRRDGVGLSNTMDRLRHHYADDHSFELEPAGEGGVIATVRLPWSAA